MSLPLQSGQLNLLLKAMPAHDFELLQPHFERVNLEKNRMLAGAGQRIKHAYFPEKAVASVVAIGARGARTEVGLFGRDSMSGHSAAVGRRQQPTGNFHPDSRGRGDAGN